MLLFKLWLILHTHTEPSEVQFAILANTSMILISWQISIKIKTLQSKLLEATSSVK